MAISPQQQQKKAETAREYKLQAERLGFRHSRELHGTILPTDALEAKFVTAQDPVIETRQGERLPAVPVEEAVKLNHLKDQVDGSDAGARQAVKAAIRRGADGTVHGVQLEDQHPPSSSQSQKPDAALRDSIAPTRTNPLFPPVPVYGPSSRLRTAQCICFRCTSAVLSFCFLLVIMLGALFSGIIPFMHRLWKRACLQDPDASRPFYVEEAERQRRRRIEESQWESPDEKSVGARNGVNRFPPLEGGPDPLVCDARYYARRQGLEMEEFSVQTEDGFIIQLWHLFDARETRPVPPELRRHKSARVFRASMDERISSEGSAAGHVEDGRRKYPVLLMHGLLQSAGAYCCTEDRSLAFYLAKAGYDVWLGNNRCGFEPQHTLLSYGDPRMWAWNIRQMGVLDLTALVSRVLEETHFDKLGLVCHSQGTTQTFVALAKEQRPDLGNKISVFCALAPAAYAGPLIKKMYFKFMRVISPGMFRIMFGIHSFIPFMMRMHKSLPGWLYGRMGYLIFSFLFGWTDERWEKDLRNRMFQFSPVYVSAESMRWWLGRECFAKQKCILSTRREGQIEDEEDEEERTYFESQPAASGRRPPSAAEAVCQRSEHNHRDRGRSAWYDEHAPPFALWVAGSDDLVDGKRLLRRFETGREPHVDIVHSKIIDGYEHLDVIWAMDSIDKVGREVKEVLWSTCPEAARSTCRVPQDCENVEPWISRRQSSRHYTEHKTGTSHDTSTEHDASKGEWSRSLQGEVADGQDMPEP